ncbi:MAG: hypothetical protein HDS62_02820 [Bacteroidales bacterium]|nr:hypothetical protein [Bacteroidales bacterium]
MPKPFPFIKQEDAMQCGVACLQKICTYYGENYSHNFISTLCHATTEGVYLLGICKAAISLGLKCQPIKATIHHLTSISSPCILHWNQNHFVILYRIKNGKYYIGTTIRDSVLKPVCLKSNFAQKF